MGCLIQYIYLQYIIPVVTCRKRSNIVGTWLFQITMVFSPGTRSALIYREKTENRFYEQKHLRNENALDCPFPIDTGRKLKIHKIFRRRPERLLNILCTFNLRPVSTGFHLVIAIAAIHKDSTSGFSYDLYKINSCVKYLKFYLISWCGNFVKRQFPNSFR